MAVCPACGAGPVADLARVGPLPVLCGSLWDSRAAAAATPTAELGLRGCERCGHVWNAAFDPALVGYDAQYDNALDFSPTFTAYAEALAGRLVADHDLHRGQVVEIGSGKGEFLRLLARLGGGRGVGYDPTYVGPERDGDLTFVRTFFTAETTPEQVDLVCCRHVLEHVEDPYGFLRDIRAALRGRLVPLYVEVPNAAFNFAESGPWDLIYPHVAYFNEVSLRLLLERAGFRVVRLEPCFADQFLGADVVPSSGPATNGIGGGRQAAALRFALDRQLAETDVWRTRLEGLLDAGPVALWGAGSKGVTFLSLVDPGQAIGTVVDANPRKWGRFLPASGHEVVAPAEVAERAVVTVLVMNPVYADEIRRDLAAMGSSAEVLVV